MIAGTPTVAHHARPHRRPRRMNSALASWYSYPAGSSTACGFSSPMGVANRTLPCGTRVLFCVTRCAVGVVDDRGPYVYPREFDLTPPLANAIGFSLSAGVETVRWALDG